MVRQFAARSAGIATEDLTGNPAAAGRSLAAHMATGAAASASASAEAAQCTFCLLLNSLTLVLCNWAVMLHVALYFKSDYYMPAFMKWFVYMLCLAISVTSLFASPVMVRGLPEQVFESQLSSIAVGLVMVIVTLYICNEIQNGIRKLQLEAAEAEQRSESQQALKG